MDYQQKYERLYDLTMENGGATVRIADYPERLVVPTVGYVVATPYSIGVYRDQFLREGFDTAVDRVLIQAQGRGYLGTWVENKDVVLVELVEVFKNKDFAMGTAYGRGEKAVYDLAAKKEIFLKV